MAQAHQHHHDRKISHSVWRIGGIVVAAEEGISILPAYCTDKLTNADNLVFIPLEGEGETEDILAVWRKDNTSTALAHFLTSSGF